MGCKTNENKTVIRINSNNIFFQKQKGKIYFQGKMKKQEMGFARRKVEIKYKAQEN